MSGYGAAALMELLTWQNIWPQSLLPLYHWNFSTPPPWISSRDTHLPFNCQNSSVASNAEKLKQSRFQNFKQRWQNWIWTLWCGVHHVNARNNLTISTWFLPRGGRELWHRLPVLLVWHGLCDADMNHTQCSDITSMTLWRGSSPRVDWERSIHCWLTTSCRLQFHNTIIHIISSQSGKINFQWIC